MESVQKGPNQKKIAKIAEVLGIIEDKHKNKEWILDEIKRYKIKLNVSPTANSFEILKSVPEKFVNHLLSNLKEEQFEIEDVKTLSKTMHWFFTDIVGSSNPNISTKTQARKIIILNKMIEKTDTFAGNKKEEMTMQHTGDGVAIGFSDSPESPIRLAIEIHKLLKKYNKTKSEKEKIYLRIGIDTGPVYFIKDLEGKETTWGPGIITTKRVMDLCGPNQIFTSRRLGDDISNLSSEYKSIMHEIGDYEIKHGKKLSIYNIYGKGFGNKKIPKENKVVDEIDIKKSDFKFNRVELKLDVTDPKSSMTHHTWVWDIKNISNSPLRIVRYEIFGDTPKDLEDMHLAFFDGKGRKLEKYSAIISKRQEKIIHLELGKPLRKNLSTKVSLEYDWEEPYKTFEYHFPAPCKKMKYQFTIPKGTEIKHKVLRVGTVGKKILAMPQATMKHTRNKTIVNWETDGKKTIDTNDRYEFQW